MILFLAERQRDAATCRCKFQGIREEVVYYLVYFLAIVVHQETVGIVLETEVDAALFGIVAKGYEYAVQMVNDVATLHVQCLATRIQATEVEQRAHLPQKLLGILVDILELSQQIVGRLSIRQFSHDLFQRRDDECQRRSQVVADIGEELQLHLRNLFHFLSLHQLPLPLHTFPLSFAHVAPQQVEDSQNKNGIQYIHGHTTIERWSHADAQFPWCAHTSVLMANAQLQRVVAGR